MRFILFVEGKTEKQALADFIARGLNPRLDQPVRLSIVSFKGAGDYVSNIKERVRLYFSGPQHDPIIATIGIIDLYGSPLRSPASSAAENAAWGKQEMERRVGHPRFKQHFAVHETEAWLLADPQILPQGVRDILPRKCSHPENVNMNEPPSRLLDRLYLRHVNRGYEKTKHGRNLFLRCAPNIVAAKCPHFSQMLTEMEQLAKTAG